MTDTAPQTGTEATDGGERTGDGFKPPESQAELNKIIAARVDRERAKYAGFDDLKAKAEKFDQLDAANKSEIERAADRAATAERDRDAARSEALRLRIAVKHGISDEDADLFLTGTDESTLTKQAQRLLEHVSDRKKNGNVVPREGAQTQARTSDGLTTIRELFSN